jgi:hypothetical protein
VVAIEKMLAMAVNSAKNSNFVCGESFDIPPTGQ